MEGSAERTGAVRSVFLISSFMVLNPNIMLLKSMCLVFPPK